MPQDYSGAKLNAKAYIDGVLYRPSIEATKAYYERDDVLEEILGAMRRWHVRLEPGEDTKHRWFYTDDPGELRQTFAELLERMSRNEQLVDFPYMRIDGRRFDPVTSWDKEDLWGLDFMIEADDRTWRPCWDAVVPMAKGLDRFGVHYWLKYTGHHSLHLVIPAESFPRQWGKLRFAEYMPSFTARLISCFCRHTCQPITHGPHGGNFGTNMPYTLNEDSGLLNYPVLPGEIDDFEPRKAGIEEAEIRSFWREFPEEQRRCAADLIEEVLKPFEKQDVAWDTLSGSPPVELSDVLARSEIRNTRERERAIGQLLWFSETEATDRIFEALEDRNLRVKKTAVRALAAVDDPRCEPVLKRLLENCPPKLVGGIQESLQILSDIEALRAEG